MDDAGEAHNITSVSMASDKKHIRHCILFAFQLGKNAAEAAKLICSGLGKDAVTHKTCKKWYQRFRSGDFCLDDEERPGAPKKFKDEELEQLLEKNPAQTQDELASQLGVSRQSISIRLSKLGKVEKLGWILHELSPEGKQNRCDTAMSLLTRYKMKDFLYKIVTGDEKWILYDNPKKRKLVDSDKSSTSIARSNIHAKKVLLSIWWDMKGVIRYELLQPEETTNTEYYQQQLLRLSDELEEKRPFTGSGARHVILQHDNAWPHAKEAKDTIYLLGWEVLPHAAYSPDLAPSDYHLFRSLQQHLADEHFKSVEEVRKCIDAFIASKSPSFFREGICQLPERWKKVIENDGEYFED